MSKIESRSVLRTAAHLRRLLRSFDYRNEWSPFAQRVRSDEIHQGAVAEVIARYLRRISDDARDDHIDPRRLKDRVSRALSGKALTANTLDLFGAAFDMRNEHRHELRALLAGSHKFFVLAGDEGCVPSEVVETLGGPGYRPVSVREHHFIGQDRMPVRHHTMQVLRALRDGVDRYRYHFDTDAAMVRVGHGCSAVLEPVRKIRDGVYSVDILLTSSMDTDDTASIEYTTIFNYLTPPPCVLRKAVRGRIESVDLRVQFSERARPSAVWWATWNSLDGPPTNEELVELDGERAAQRYLEEMEDVIVGLHWRW